MRIVAEDEERDGDVEESQAKAPAKQVRFSHSQLTCPLHLLLSPRPQRAAQASDPVDGGGALRYPSEAPIVVAVQVM